MHCTQLPPGLKALAAAQYGLVSVGQAREHGISAQRCVSLVQQGRWRRVTLGVYDTAPSEVSQWPDRDAHARAAVAMLLRYGPDAVAVGVSALALHGVDGLPARVAPTVALPSGLHGRLPSGLHGWLPSGSHGRLPSAGSASALRQYVGMEIREVDGRRVAAPAWALVQALPTCDRDTGVSILDSAQYRGVADGATIAEALDLLHGRRGAVRVRAWFALTDGRAQSPLETRVRLRCHDGDVPPDDLQVAVFSDTGTHLGDGDLGWKRRDGTWLIAEADGEAPHSGPVALLRDRSRQNDFVMAGHVVARFTWADTRLATSIPRTIRRLLDR